MLEINKKDLVPAKDIEVKTKMVEVKIGIEPAEYSRGLEVDLSGLLVSNQNNGRVYSIFRNSNNENVFMYIPNPTTFNNLFRDWNRIAKITFNEADEIVDSFSSGAILASGNKIPGVFLISGGKKRWIKSPAVMDKYYFSWNKIYVVPQILINSIPTGSIIE